MAEQLVEEGAFEGWEEDCPKSWSRRLPEGMS